MRMILFNLCSQSGTLMVFVIIKILFSIIFTIIPLILIYRSIVPCVKCVINGEPFTKELGSLIKSFISGFVVFMLPTLFMFVFESLISVDGSGISACFANASLDNVNRLRENEAKERSGEISNNRKKLDEQMKKQQDEEARRNEIIRKRREELERQRQEQGGTSSGTGIWSESTFPLPSGATSCRSSVFGPRNHPITGEYENHSGDDYPAACGTSVYAVLDGKVIEAFNDGGYHYGMGNYVKIQHSDGTVSVYMHSSNVLVSVGQTVRKGQEIMKVGTTGSSTGCHLHITIKNSSGTNVAPSSYIPTLSSCS
ncbi:MAG: M23 family metallopeptidase, partial [Bacilli bacterium]|nr:M23 family metallopeptidase [Bacilli bacterium]